MPLSREQAQHFASLPLAGLTREYPNHLMHLLNGAQDAQAPSALHPIFYGCFDWHSAVHGYWLLAHCARTFPDLPQADAIQALFARHFTAPRAEGELDYFLQPGRAAFERPYGWAWLLKLTAELRQWRVPQAPEWHSVLRPLAELLRGRLLEFLPRQRQPIRTGTHYNTAFALLLALDYARTESDAELEAALRAAARRYYAADTDYPSRYEPGGDDFLSGALTEAALLSALLPQAEFVAWFSRFLPDMAAGRGDPLLTAVEIGDRSDSKIVHLDGLHLSRAWCLRRIAAALPAAHAASTAMRDGADRLETASLPHVASGNYNGEHWLASFAALAVGAA
jgi:hypothetical protein